MLLLPVNDSRHVIGHRVIVVRRIKEGDHSEENNLDRNERQHGDLERRQARGG